MPNTHVFWHNPHFFPYCQVVFSQNISFFCGSFLGEKKCFYKRMNINMENLTMGIAYEDTFLFSVCKRTKVAGKDDISLYPCFQQQCPICVNRHVFGTWNPKVTMTMQLPISEKMRVSLVVLSSLHVRQGGTQVSALTTTPHTKREE